MKMTDCCKHISVSLSAEWRFVDCIYAAWDLKKTRRLKFRADDIPVRKNEVKIIAV